MTEPDQPAAPPSGDHLEIGAAELAEILAGQVAGLRNLTTGLEQALSASLCNCKPLGADALMTLQRLDYLRQSLKDLEGLLLRFGPSLGWASGHQVTHALLQDAVDMDDSIQPILKASRKLTAGADPTQSGPAAGELDLW